MTSLSNLRRAAGLLCLLSYASLASGFRVKPSKRSSALQRKHKETHQEKKAAAKAEYYDYDYDYDPGAIGPLPSVCSTNWTDSMKFDCQLYEGAGWCEYGADYQLGLGWCDKRKKCDKTSINRGGYALPGDQRWGWGTFKDFTSNKFPTTAQQACRGCGADCPADPPKRTLNNIGEGCIDYPAPNGQVWRGNAGYTCGAYHYGGFCIKRNNRWIPGKLMEGYGELDTYKHFAMNGTRRVKMGPLQACCTCGGGSTCTNGWKPPSECEREFSYKGKLYSGCTTEANADVSGSGAWCSHKSKYEKNEWSSCSAC